MSQIQIPPPQIVTLDLNLSPPAMANAASAPVDVSAPVATLIDDVTDSAAVAPVADFFDDLIERDRVLSDRFVAKIRTIFDQLRAKEDAEYQRVVMEKDEIIRKLQKEKEELLEEIGKIEKMKAEKARSVLEICNPSEQDVLCYMTERLMRSPT